MITAVKNQKGQALIELIIFLPLMFSLYGIISGFANAINGSINQQKITRAYFYFRIQNSSMIPNADYGVAQGWSKFGMFFIGWADYLEDETNPVMPCYEITIPLSNNGSDKCETPYTGESTQFIRVGTVYGVCGATYGKTGGGQFFTIPDYEGSSYAELTNVDSCTISK